MSIIDTIKSGLRTLQSIGRDTHINVAGHDYIYSDARAAYEPAKNPKDTARHAVYPDLLDVDSLAAWANAIGACVEHKDGEPIGAITIGRANSTAGSTPVFIGPDTVRETATKRFYMGFMPGQSFTKRFDYTGFISWVEMLGERMESAEAVLVAFKALTATDGSVKKVSNDGPFFTVHTENSKGVKGAAKAPKRLVANIPFGDPGCICRVQFSLQIVASSSGDMTFTVTHLESDGAFDAYQDWMQEVLESTVNDGWLILKGT